MPLETITLNVKDSVKIMDYAEPRGYSFTAHLSNPTEPEIDHVLAIMTARGNAFLKGETRVEVRTTAEAKPVTKAKAKDPTPPAPPAETQPPAPVQDPLEAAASVSAPGTGTEAGTAGTSATTSADVSDLLPEPVKEISNEEIVHAVMAKNETLKDATPIRALVETYNPSPGLRVFKATEIAAEKRADFMARLAELKPAA